MSVFRASNRWSWWERAHVRILALIGLITVALVAVLLIVSAFLISGQPSR